MTYILKSTGSISLLFFFVTLLTHGQVQAQDFSAYQKKMFINSSDTMPYRLLAPENMQPGKKYPLVIVLHGSGETGADNEKQLVHGATLFLTDSNRKRYPAFVLFPQCPENSYWSDVEKTIDKNGKEFFSYQKNGPPTKAMALLIALEKYAVSIYPIDTKRVYVGGLSMGGMGAFEIVRRMSQTFAAAFPICGGADPATAPYLLKTSWWIFHGLKDDIVDPEFSEHMREALTKNGAHVKATFYPDANHNSWDNAFAEPVLLPWLFSNHL